MDDGSAACYICQAVYMDTQLQRTASVFKALSDPTRLRILGLLLTGEVCVCHIHDTLRIPQPKASRHLAYLRAVGLVDARRDGLWMHYKLADLPDPILQSVSEMARHALTHLETVQKDAGRLQKKTGCCLPAVESTELPCCTADARP
jgi:ArsR family transcriptional regulator, arsenate/arsenite/antimonite-responsive transcriptional repressor